MLGTYRLKRFLRMEHGLNGYAIQSSVFSFHKLGWCRYQSGTEKMKQQSNLLYPGPDLYDHLFQEFQEKYMRIVKMIWCSSCTGLRKNFKNGSHHISWFRIKKQAEELLILGPSGCGKTILTQHPCGIVWSQMGLMTFLGVDFHALNASEDDRHGKHIGLCLRNRFFIRALSVVDNLLLSQRLAGLIKIAVKRLAC